MNWLAWDIGGANLKVADGRGFAASYAFPLWREQESLEARLRRLIVESPRADHLAVTMTGELADCFESKEDGVRQIVDAVEAAAPGMHLRIYRTDGKLVSAAVARAKPELVAASNWHALARFATRFASRFPAVLIDVGSSTCDILPLAPDGPATDSQTDLDRLLAGELVYVGVERTPACGLMEAASYRGRRCPMARELFATTLDAFLLLGEISENEFNTNTADGRPLLKRYSRARLGRMLCATGKEFNHRDAVVIAQAIAEAARKRIAAGLWQVLQALPEPLETIVFSGHGEFLARKVVGEVIDDRRPIMVSLGDQLGRAVTRCANAHALAVLAQEL